MPTTRQEWDRLWLASRGRNARISAATLNALHNVTPDKYLVPSGELLPIDTIPVITDDDVPHNVIRFEPRRVDQPTDTQA